VPVSPFSQLDAAAVARTLSQIAEQPDDLADAYFERREDVELQPESEGPGLRVLREEGFAVRLVRGGRTYFASGDGIAGKPFAEAVRQVARALPAANYSEPSLTVAPWPRPPDTAEPASASDLHQLAEFPALVARAIRAHHVGFPLRLTVRRHRRDLVVVGSRLAAEPQSETFYSCAAELAWGRHGALFPELTAGAAQSLADACVALFRARNAPPAELANGVAVLGPAATAVLLHEAVAHALEADTLAATGRPEAALGLALGAPCLDVLDDPGAAPAGVRRTSDDEGTPVCRRWLLRRGIVEQPLADALWSRLSPAYLPGAGRRGSRHLPPGPRSSHLELLPGDAAEADLLAEAEGGLYLEVASRGALDPVSGEFVLHLPYARRIRKGVPAEVLGPCALRGRVADLLARATAVGREARAAGAGWCAKGGQKLPVWATAPALRLEGVGVTRP
jgi:predicted Zn-dependent protease